MSSADEFSYIPPADDVVEVVVLGAGVGESIVIHVGDGQWVVVDSFMAEDGTQPAALEYLTALGVDLDDVVALVATHWDDDHIAGMLELVKRCRLASFSCSGALLTDEFRAIVRQKHPRGEAGTRPTGVRELAAIDALLKAEGGRRGPRELKGGDSFVSTADWKLLPLRVLAPSEFAVRAARQQYLETLNSELIERDTVQIKDRNLASVVLWLETAGRRALLGGDFVPSGASALLGWHPIITAASHLERAQIYKVAHHGSPGTRDDEVWSNVLVPEAFAAVTAYTAHPNALPTPASRRRIRRWTPRGVVIGTSQRQHMAMDEMQRELTKRMSWGRSDVIRLLGHPGKARYRAAPGPATLNDWDFSKDGNVVPIQA